MSVTVITATTGSPFLREALASVAGQTYEDLQHWVVVDGQQYAQKVQDILKDFRNVKLLILPENTGGPEAGNFVCHRIYAAAPFLVNTEFVALLDEDNMYEPDHIELLVTEIQRTKRKWAHSLRALVDQEGTVLDTDRCESLGGIRHSVLSANDFHVDTNCYLLETNLARSLAPCWNVPARPGPDCLEADRAVCRTLLASKLYPAVSRNFTVKYRVSGRADSVSIDFFRRGNAMIPFDPQKPDLYLLHFTAEATKTFLSASQHNPLSEWAMTLWQGLHQHFNVLDGFANAAIIPPSAVVLATLWHPRALPLDLLKRTDIRRLLFLLESPNIRHAEQFQASFLDAHADVVLSYWQVLLNRMGPHRSIFCPMNTHCLDLDDPQHQKLGLRSNLGKGKSIAMVLERRPQLAGCYEIDGVTLQCLDPLRERYARGLKGLVCYGKGWEGLPGIQVGHTLGKMADPRHAVDILQNYSFALIIENCDAEGYVSEKLYDALMAGCIPLYYGSPSKILDLPPEAYIDIRQYEDGEALQQYMDSLHPEDVYRLKVNILKIREKVLRSVGVHRFADIVLQALQF